MKCLPYGIHTRTVQLPCLETCGMKKWGKTKEKGDASTCLMARDVSEKYHCQTQRPLENWEQAVTLLEVINGFAQIVVGKSYNLARRISTSSYPHTLNIFQASS